MATSSLISHAAAFPAMCFGKLPAFGDFVRHDASGRDVLVFDQWLQQGLHHARARLGADWDASARCAPAYGFLFFPENAESFLFGLIRPSHDRSERPFPFVLALRVDRRFSMERLAFAPVVFAAFLDGAARLADEAARGSTLQEIGDALELLRPPVKQDYAALIKPYVVHLASTRLSERWTGLWNEPADTVDGRARLVFGRLLDLLIPFRGWNPARFKLGLRFPIAGDDVERGYATSFWIEATLRMLDAREARPFYFWTTAQRPGATAQAGHLFLFLHEPSTRTVVHFVRPDLAGSDICWLDAPRPSLALTEHARLPHQLDHALAGKQTSLYALLDTLSGGWLDAVARRGASC
jgi:type VI secretion system ImpM family protein